MLGIAFEWTITLGHVLTMAIVVLIFSFFFVSDALRRRGTRRRINMIEEQIASLKLQTQALSNLIRDVGRETHEPHSQ